MKENNDHKQQVQSISEEMNNKLSDILALIQQNPKLSNIKPQSLLEKISNVEVTNKITKFIFFIIF
jgi:hypothetical protein